MSEEASVEEYWC